MNNKIVKFIPLILIFQFVQITATEESTASFEWLNNQTTIKKFVKTELFEENPDVKNLISNHNLHGQLTLTSINKTTKIKIYKDFYKSADDKALLVQQLPPIKVDIVQHEQWLIPTVRTVQRSSHPYWEWQLSPGKIWQQSGDHGFLRAAFPFSLQEKNANCTHHGLILFLINESGETSKGVFQIASETCAYFQFDLAGRTRVEFEHKSIPNDVEIVDQFKDELSHKPNRYTAKDLKVDYPKLDVQKIMPNSLATSTTSGVVIKGKHYSLNCNTRYGPYPYCEWLALPSFSTSKSIFAGLGLMRLQAQVPNIEHALVTKLIPECDQKQWQKVTLGDLINMRSGNYISKNPHSDEASMEMLKFFLAQTNAQKLQVACNSFPKKSEPGKRFNYHTSDTYLAGVMLNNLYLKMTGSSNFYKNVLVDDLWKSIHLSPLLNESKRTYDDTQQAFTGYGLTYYVDDIIKISNFLNDRQQSNQRLDQTILHSAMQVGKNRLNREGGSENLAYNYGFWALQGASQLGCKKPKWIPFMSGFGGITIAMVSPDILYYNFADDQRFIWLDKIVEINRLFSICESNR